MASRSTTSSRSRATDRPPTRTSNGSASTTIGRTSTAAASLSTPTPDAALPDPTRAGAARIGDRTREGGPGSCPRSDFRGHLEALLVGGNEGAVGGQVEAGVLEAVVVAVASGS